VALSYHLVFLVKKWSDLFNTVLITYYLIDVYYLGLLIITKEKKDFRTFTSMEKEFLDVSSNIFICV
jgi:hypothetical protein